MNITITGTAEEIIAFAKTLELGRKTETDSSTKDEVDQLGVECLKVYDTQNPIAAMKFYRMKTGSALKEAREYIESLVSNRANLILDKMSRPG
jgi:ribosomal protein L7/L12